jgi:hypothetical protein
VRATALVCYHRSTCLSAAADLRLPWLGPILGPGALAVASEEAGLLHAREAPCAIPRRRSGFRSRWSSGPISGRGPARADAEKGNLDRLTVFQEKHPVVPRPRVPRTTPAARARCQNTVDPSLRAVLITIPWYKVAHAAPRTLGSRAAVQWPARGMGTTTRTAPRYPNRRPRRGLPGPVCLCQGVTRSLMDDSPSPAGARARREGVSPETARIWARLLEKGRTKRIVWPSAPSIVAAAIPVPSAGRIAT